MLGLTILGISYGFFSLMKSSYAPGWDSYFYILQIKSWFETGSLHSFRINLIYPVIGAIQWVTNDYVTSYKVFVLLSYSFFGLSCYITSRLFKAKPFWALTVGLISILNPHTIFVASQFSKNLMAMGFFILLVGVIPKKKWKYILPLLILLALSHKLMLILGVIFGVVYFIIDRYQLHILVKIAIPYLLAGLVALGFYLFKPEQIAHNFDLPIIRFFKSHGPLMTANWKTTLIIICLVPLLNIPFFKKLSKEQQNLCVAIGAVYLMLNIPFLNWDPMGYAYRFFMVFGSIAIISLSVLRIPDILKYIVLASTAFLSFFSTNTYSPKLHDPPYTKYAFISASVAEHIQTKKPDLIICHKSLAEFISFETSQDVLPWGIPSNEVSNSTLRLVYVPSEYKTQFKHTVGSEAEQVTLNYYLTPEAVYQEKWLSSLSDEDIRDFKTWRNPYLIR